MSTKKWVQDNIIFLDEVADMLGYSTRTILDKINNEGLPMHKSEKGGRLIGYIPDIMRWFRAKYPEQYKELIRDTSNTEDYPKNGQLYGELYGVAVDDSNGKRSIVEGADFVQIFQDKQVGKRICSIMIKGTVHTNI